MDLRNDAVGKFYGGGAPEDNWVGHLTGSVATHYGKFEAWLKQHGTKYLACDAPTAPDFHLFEMIDQHGASTAPPTPQPPKQRLASERSADG